MSLTNIFSLFGGLALFLFGMNLMGSALEKSAGNRLKSILANLTSNPVKGFILGLGVTLLIQSSSATTVMVVGFVNSGIMELSQATGIIFGSNLGASITSWLISLTGIQGDAWYIQMCKPETFTPVLAFIGILLYMFTDLFSHGGRSSRKKDTGLILLGFAILMYGMEVMSGAVKPLSQNESFQRILVLFSNPILGVLVGTVFTAIIQSSGASVGILQALSLTGTISFNTAVPIIMGQNIGTCITAMISSVGANRNAKRAAIIHLSFNVIATLILLPVYYLISWLFHPAIIDSIVGPIGIAVIHTIFKIIALAIIMPFSKQLQKLSFLILPDKAGSEESQLLDERLLHTPAVAIEHCKTVARAMADTSVKSLLLASELLNNYDEKTAAEIRRMEESVDKYEDKLGSYLVKLSSQEMTEHDSAEATKLLHIIGDFERISDHSVNIVESVEEINDKKLVFSDEARREIAIISSAVTEILGLALTSFDNDDLDSATLVEPLEQVIDTLRDRLKKRHINRLRKNECTIELGFVLSDLLVNFERVSDHCSNIACCMIEMSHESMDMHEYQSIVKSGNMREFNENYDYYKLKYSLE